MKVFVFGLGYSALASVRALRQIAGDDPWLAGTTRSAETRDALADVGISAHLFEGREISPELLSDLNEATHILLSIPPGEDGDPALSLSAGLSRDNGLQWIGYFSTVGVYGDHGGAWVDEGASTDPVHPRSQRRLEAEKAWRGEAKRLAVPLMVLRLAGIYGPGRSALDKLREGKARRIVKPGQVFNRIHVEDIGRITALAMTRNLAGLFNLADDEPAPPQDVVTFAAALMHVPLPAKEPFETADMTPMARTFYSSNERIANAAIKKALGIDLLYPTYRQGLNAIRSGDPGMAAAARQRGAAGWEATP